MGLGETLDHVVTGSLAWGERLLSGDRQETYADRINRDLTPKEMLDSVEGLVSHLLNHPGVQPTNKVIDALVFACSFHSDVSNPENSAMSSSVRGWAADCLGTYRDQLEGRHAILLAQALNKEVAHQPDSSSEMPQRLAEVMVAASQKLSAAAAQFEIRQCRTALDGAKAYLGVSYDSLSQQFGPARPSN